MVIMTTPHFVARSRNGALSLVEMLGVVSIVGILTGVAILGLRSVPQNVDETVVTHNALEVDSTSGVLAGMGIYHVIPDSLGGVEATVRWMNCGIEVQREERRMVYTINQIPESNIFPVTERLERVLDSKVVRLEYRDLNNLATHDALTGFGNLSAEPRTGVTNLEFVNY